MKKLRKWSEDSAFTPFKMDKEFLTLGTWKGYKFCPIHVCERGTFSVKNDKGGKGLDLRVEPPLIKPGSDPPPPQPNPSLRGAELENRDFKIQQRGRQWEHQKTIGLISKTTTSHVHHTFLYISFPFLHDYNVKMPNFTFYGECKNNQRWNFISLSELEYGALKFNSERARLQLTK